MPISNVVIPDAINDIIVKSISTTPSYDWGCGFAQTTIKSIVLPATIESIPSFSFTGCYFLRTMTFKGSVPPTFSTLAFSFIDGCDLLQAIYVPSESVDAYKEALASVPYKKVGSTTYYASEIVQAMP